MKKVNERFKRKNFGMGKLGNDFNILERMEEQSILTNR